MAMKYICAVCGYDQLDEPQWEGDAPSYEICPCCFFQAGFDDDGASEPVTVEEYRKSWLRYKGTWANFLTRRPENWNLREQLKNINVDLDKEDKPVIRSIGHITFSVADMERAVTFYINIFGVQPLLVRPQTAYFESAGIWWTLNLQENITRQDIQPSYTHIAFSVKEEDMETLQARLLKAGATIEESHQHNPNGERNSIYFRDPDGHLLEFHTGTLEQQLDYYRT